MNERRPIDDALAAPCRRTRTERTELMPVYNTPQRPTNREDGWPTRSDIRYDTDAERLCRVLVGLVEDMGASVSLTRAVTLLAQARDAIADHVERIEPETPTRPSAALADPAPEPQPPLETRVEYGHQTVEVGWIPEHRGIKYATHQRTVHFRTETPLMIDHWSDPDGIRKPFDPPVTTPAQAFPAPSNGGRGDTPSG